jgi:hypothetical protein
MPSRCHFSTSLGAVVPLIDVSDTLVRLFESSCPYTGHCVPVLSVNDPGTTVAPDAPAGPALVSVLDPEHDATTSAAATATVADPARRARCPPELPRRPMAASEPHGGRACDGNLKRAERQSDGSVARASTAGYSARVTSADDRWSA